MKFKLYHYWRSSASWRVRWALALKSLDCEFVAVNLLADEQKSEEHLKRNPLGAVPTLEITDNVGARFLSESIAILEWLEETHPKHSLFPKDAYLKALVRQLAQIINAGTHPLQNLNTQKYYSEDVEKRKIWSQHWIKNGLGAYEKIAAKTAGNFSVGDQVTVADLCLIPQCYNAIRNSVEMGAFPNVKRIYEACLKTEACQKSHPDGFKPEV